MRRLKLLVGAVVVAVALVSGASGSAGSVQARWVITDLGGTLPGMLGSSAMAVNARGQVLCNAGDSASAEYGVSKYGQKSRAFLWERGKVTDLGSLGGGFTFAEALNDRGQVVGLSTTRTGQKHAFLWEKGRMIDLNPLGQLGSEAVALNERGQVVGNTHTSDGYGDAPRAFLWEKGRMRDLGVLPGRDWSWAVAINERGQVVGLSGSQEMSSWAVFLWAGGTLTALRGGQPAWGGTSPDSVDINEAGQIVGTVNTGSVGTPVFRAMLWRQGRPAVLRQGNCQSPQRSRPGRHRFDPLAPWQEARNRVPGLWHQRPRPGDRIPWEGLQGSGRLPVELLLPRCRVAGREDS